MDKKKSLALRVATAAVVVALAGYAAFGGTGREGVSVAGTHAAVSAHPNPSSMTARPSSPLPAPAPRKPPKATVVRQAGPLHHVGAPRAFGEREGKGEVRPDHPDEAMRFRRQSLMDENGVIPMDGLERAKAHMQQMRNAGDGPAAAGINRTSWTWLGPGNIGGRTRALAIHPTNTSIIFAGTVGGGIWKTTNGGASWAPVDDFMANLAVSSIVFRPGERPRCMRAPAKDSSMRTACGAPASSGRPTAA